MIEDLRSAYSGGRTYREYYFGEPGLGDIDGIPERWWKLAFQRIYPTGNTEFLLAQIATLIHNSGITEAVYSADLYDYWQAKKPPLTKQQKENKIRAALGFPPLT